MIIQLYEKKNMTTSDLTQIRFSSLNKKFGGKQLLTLVSNLIVFQFHQRNMGDK